MLVIPVQPAGHEAKCPCVDCESWAVALLDWERENLAARIVDAVAAVGSSLVALAALCEQAPVDVYEATSDQIADAGLLSLSVEDSAAGFFALAEQVRRVIG